MAKLNWVIQPSTLVKIGITCLVYTVFAELVGLDPLWEMPGPRQHLLRRAGEFTILWIVLCSVVGWIAVARVRPPSPDSHIWPILLVPVVIGACLIAGETLDPRHMRTMAPSYFDRVTGMSPFITLLVTVLGCVILGIEAVMWRYYGLKGVCFECGHDLHGQGAGRCPECRTQFDENSSYATHLSSTTYPELLLFPTAEQRCQAGRQIRRGTARSPLYIGVWIAWGVLMFAIMEGRKASESAETWQWPALLGVMILFVAFFYVLHRRTHTHLRKSLLAAGIAVCMKCGSDLREVHAGACPKCGATMPAIAEATK